jgi:hypothetical protein
MLQCTVKKSNIKLLKQFHKLRPYPITCIMAIESNGVREAGRASCMGKARKVYKILIGKSDRKFCIGRR